MTVFHQIMILALSLTMPVLRNYAPTSRKRMGSITMRTNRYITFPHLYVSFSMRMNLSSSTQHQRQQTRQQQCTHSRHPTRNDQTHSMARSPDTTSPPHPHYGRRSTTRRSRYQSSMTQGCIARLTQMHSSTAFTTDKARISSILLLKR